jgi:uncharacterized RDD family membrane protein YckC
MMGIPKLYQIILKDLFDFVFIFLATFILTIVVYALSPVFQGIYLSLYFFEQFVELFFVNPKLFIWLLGLGLGVSMLYFLLGTLAFGTTLGGRLMGIGLVAEKTHQPLSPARALLLSIGAYFGAIFFGISPLYAWWFDPHHRGLSLKIARVEPISRVYHASC